jgi:hypothetical protein
MLTRGKGKTGVKVGGGGETMGERDTSFWSYGRQTYQSAQK